MTRHDDHNVDDVIVFVGGASIVPFVGTFKDRLPKSAWSIAADSGLHVAEALDHPVHLIVGDLDSVDLARLAVHEHAGVAVDRHPVDKDRTDLEIALDHARSKSPRRITVVGGGGGRLDHLMGNLSQLARPDLDGINVVAYLPPATVHIVTDDVTVTGQVGEPVSLVPVHGDARGVTTTGLEFPLSDDNLPAATSRGISNRFSSPQATVNLQHGRLLMIRPGVT
ncbi:MAG: thiamine diphosphokinase [Nitriliruptoraceae bacterium]